MRKRAKILSAIAALVALCFLLGAITTDHEPTYKGLTMGQWLHNNGQPKATEALLRLGTNNLPLLVRRLEFTSEGDPVLRVRNWLPSRLAYSGFMNSLSHPYITDLFNREQLAREAEAIFRKLGTNASPAIPQLTFIAEHGKGAPSTRALDTLAALGDDGAAALVCIARSTNSNLRLSAVVALSFHTESSLALSGLTNALHDPSAQIRATAAEAMRIGLQHSQAQQSLSASQ